MLKKIKQKERGLTLVEVLVAVLLLTLGLVPIFGVISSSVNLASRIEDNLVAANLAQEGVEIVRAIRDASWMNGEPFDQDLPNGDYLVSWNSNALIAYDPNAYLKIDTNKIYSYITGADTIFKRRINIAKVVSACNCELKIISEVAWSERGVNKVITTESHLFDWR